MKLIRTLLSATIAALGLVALTATAQAAEIYSTFGPGDSYNAANGYILGGPNTQSVAGFFTATQDYTLTSFDFAATYTSGPNSFLFSIVEDSGFKPLGATVVSPFGGLIDTGVNSYAVSGSLIAGKNYWLVIEPGAANANASWHFNNIGASGTFAFKNTQPPPIWVASAGTLPTFRIHGNRVITPALTPEMPSGLQAVPVLLAVGGMALYQRRRKKTVNTMDL